MQFRNITCIVFSTLLLVTGLISTAGAAGSQAELAQPVPTITAGVDQSQSLAALGETQRGRGNNPLDDWQAQAISYAWIDISATGQTAAVSGNDSTSSPISMGISFRWFGTTQTQIRISTNGFLTFGDTANTGQNTSIPSTAEPNGAFYVFWDDLMVDESAGDWIKYLTDTANNRFIVTWHCRRLGGTLPVDFQAILNVNGQVIYQYQNLDVRESCTIGLENSTGTDGLQMCFDGSGVIPTASSAYRLAEPAGTPNPVTNLTALVLGTNVALTWTNPTTDVYGSILGVDSCDIYLGSTLIGRVGPGVNAYGHANTALGTLVYTVYAWNGVFPNPVGYRSLPASVTVDVSEPVFSYQEDFELSNGGWTATPAINGWEWGIPTAANGPASAHSGSRLWGTVLNGNYANNACYQLELSATQPVNSTNAAVSFWGWYRSEGTSNTTYDGCNFRISTDGGSNWQVLMPVIGLYDDTLMTTNNTCIGYHKPTWNGSRAADSLVAGRWRYFVLPLSGFVGQTPIFRFSFGSDPQAANFAGFYIDDLSICGLAPGGGATISGTITLDGEMGSVTETVVRANGFGAPLDYPNAQGAYELANVQPGARILMASLTGYQPASTNITVTGDTTDVDMTLRRQVPPAPTNLTATLAAGSEIVALNWDDSPDTFVDLYRVYRKHAADSSYTLNRVIYGRTASQAVDTLPEALVYHYVVTAVDTNVIAPPIESGYSNRADVANVTLPPQSLHARTDFDDHVRLTWVGPTDPPMVELSYDNGTSSPEVSGIGFSSQPLFGWIATRFQTEGAVVVYRLRIYFTENALPGDAFQVGLFADNGSGRPTFTPLDVMNATMELPLNSFRDFYLTTPRTFTDGIFYVGARQLGDWPLNIGGDIESPFINNTFFFAADPWSWTTFEPTTMAIPLMHAVVQSTTTQAMVLHPSGWEYSDATTESKLVSHGSEPSATLTYLTELSSENIAQLTASRLSYTTGPRAPHAEAISIPDRDRSTLDDPDYYIVYRNGIDVAHPTSLSYNDYVDESHANTYWLTARYDDGSESSHSDTVTAMPAMPPGAPVVTGMPLGLSTIEISWINPTQNADGSPCVDLDSLRIYRDGILLATVPSSITQYIDTPAYPTALYTWSVRGVDEASNAGPAGVYSGSVLPPWEEVLFNWIDISASGTNTGATGNDATSGPIPLGFVFPFYGSYYSQVRVCTNGWLSFLSTASVNYTNIALPSPADPNAAIYPFWDNLNVVASSGQWVKYRAEPSRFTISWHCQLSSGSTGPFDFQVVLEENGTITLQYLSLPSVINSFTLGVENATGTSALLLLYNGNGDWTPGENTAIRIFAPHPVFAPVSGTVAFDGGNGTMTSVTITASGENHPSIHPLADGTWTMDEVATGYRQFIAHLTGFVSDTVFAVVPDTGLSNISLVLRRNNPPAPTGFTATVNTATQIVTMDWNDSPDGLVDAYRIYRKLSSASTWTLLRTVIGRTNSASSDTLVGLTGGYHYSVTAIDTNVTGSPVESDRSPTALVIAGHPAPNNLTADGRFDDRIRLTWSVPGAANSPGFISNRETAGISPMDFSGSVKATSLARLGDDEASTSSARDGRSTLDEVINYKIYRDNVLLTTVAGTVLQYNDTNVVENQPHNYYVTALYDDNQESGLSNVVSNARCNLAPGVPTDFTLTPRGTTMQLSWSDPTVNALNADNLATFCSDLVKIYIYRDNVLIDSVNAGVNVYTDSPPEPTEVYTWSLRALDEVPNLSASISAIGIIESPWQPAVYDWIDISSTGTTISFSSTDDANSGPFSLGFEFPYYGENYTNVRVCTNGWLTFSSSTSTTYSNTTIPNTSVPNATLYIFWDDLVITSGWVKYLSDPVNGRFIVTWNTIRRSTTDPYTQMQIILESSGAVKYQYQGVPTLLNSCTIGLENATGTEAIQLLAAGAAEVWTPAAQSAVEFWGGPSGSVEGTVLAYPISIPIVNCAVWATSAEQNSDTVYTDVAGYYILRTEPGAYTLYFDHPNYCPMSADIIIEDNVPLTQNMQIRSLTAQFSVTSFTMEAPVGIGGVATFTIRNQPNAPCVLDYSISDTSDWLRVVPESGILNSNQTDTIRVYADVQNYPVYTELYSSLVITYHGAGSPYTIPVDVIVVPNTSSEDLTIAPPTEFALWQSYPNPFNSTTQLRFDVPKESRVDIVIYNVMGQEIAHPVSRIYPAGRYGVPFEASGMPSGMYLVRMQSGEYVGMNKMLLLK